MTTLIDPTKLPARVDEVALSDGSSVTVSGDRVELRDPVGRLLVRYDKGSVEIMAPAGDLVLSAPTGRVRIAAADIELDAERDLVHRAGREVKTAAPLVTTVATRLVEKVHDAFRDVTDLAQSRIGRARTIVKDAFTLHARRTAMVSTEDTSIDGKKILLG